MRGRLAGQWRIDHYHQPLKSSRGKPSITYTLKALLPCLHTARSDTAYSTVTQYSTMIPEAFMNRMGTTMNPSVREFNYDPNDPYWYHNYSNNVNWVDAISQQGFSQDLYYLHDRRGEKGQIFCWSRWLFQSNRQHHWHSPSPGSTPGSTRITSFQIRSKYSPALLTRIPIPGPQLLLTPTTRVKVLSVM